MKVFKIILIVLFAAQITFSVNAQVKDEVFGVDPVKSIRLYPNPAVDFINVKFENPHAKTAKVVLHNIIGNEIFVETEVLDEHEIHVKVKELPTGYYLITINQDDGTTNHRSTYKFLKR
jgi:Secretion system C-terminal sorting domain